MHNFNKQDIQIRFNDVDIAGHVNNAMYQHYLDYGKLRLFDDIFTNTINWEKQGFVLLKIEIEYFLPVYLHDKIEILSKITEVKNKSLIIEQIITEKSNYTENGIKAKANSVMVAYDFIKKESMIIPEDWRKHIK